MKKYKRKKQPLNKAKGFLGVSIKGKSMARQTDKCFTSFNSSSISFPLQTFSPEVFFSFPSELSRKINQPQCHNKKFQFSLTVNN